MTKLSSTLFASLALTGLALTQSVAAEDVVISGDWVRLGDVSNVTGAPGDRQIAAAPLPGQRLPLASEFIEAQAAAAGFPIDLPDGEMVWVTRSANAVATSQPAAATPQQAEPTPTIYQDEPAENEVPMLITDVRRGDEITPDMISYEAMNPNRRIQGLIRAAHVLDGMEATRTIRAGQPIAMRDIRPVSVVRQGDPIQLVYQRGALRLVVSARALNDAAEGEPVRVQNLQSNRSMDAVAWGPGEARVGSLFSQEG